MVEKGIGTYQIGKSTTSENEILNSLTDGEWHRYQDMQRSTRLSTATLSKHLKRLENGIVEKRLDLESGAYPYPVYYRLTPSLTKTDREWKETLKNEIQLNLDLLEQNPERYFHFLTVMLNLETIKHLQFYFLRPKQNEVAFDQLMEFFVFSAYHDSIEKLRMKLKEHGEKSIQQILAKAEKRITEDFKLTCKKLSKRK
jgi:DNA-binding HxlR family transcriptional regulator